MNHKEGAFGARAPNENSSRAKYPAGVESETPPAYFDADVTTGATAGFLALTPAAQ
jgi:hypothetical protein